MFGQLRSDRMSVENPWYRHSVTCAFSATFAPHPKNFSGEAKYSEKAVRVLALHYLTSSGFDKVHC